LERQIQKGLICKICCDKINIIKDTSEENDIMKKPGRRLWIFAALLLTVLISVSCAAYNEYELSQDYSLTAGEETAVQPAAEQQTKTQTEEQTEPEQTTEIQTQDFVWYEFASEQLFEEHYQKHVVTQKEFGDITRQEYLEMVNVLLNSSGDNILTKMEEDGDLLVYNVDTNEFAVLRPDGVIRTYFKPSAGIDYFNRQ
jgi:hypothetical protein